MILAIDTFPRERFGLVTGSRCSPLVPKRSAEVGQRTLAKQLANEIFFQHYDERSTYATEHGKMAEHFAHEHYITYHDKQVIKGEWRCLPEIQVGGSPDALATYYGIDYKCPVSLEGWMDYMYDGISDDQYNQCQLYMLITGYDKWVIAAYLTETQMMSDNGLTYPVAESQRMILNEVNKDEAWSEKFFFNLPKVISMRDSFVEMLKNKFK